MYSVHRRRRAALGVALLEAVKEVVAARELCAVDLEQRVQKVAPLEQHTKRRGWWRHVNARCLLVDQRVTEPENGVGHVVDAFVHRNNLVAEGRRWPHVAPKHRLDSRRSHLLEQIVQEATLQRIVHMPAVPKARPRAAWPSREEGDIVGTRQLDGRVERRAPRLGKARDVLDNQQAKGSITGKAKAHSSFSSLAASEQVVVREDGDARRDFGHAKRQAQH